MKRQIMYRVGAAILAISLSTLPALGHAQQTPAQDDGVFVLGSILYSILHFPMKLVTCVGTQAGAAVAYTATYGVPGSYDGGTNGKEIGEVARRSCTGAWIITPAQVKSDFGS